MDEMWSLDPAEHELNSARPARRLSHGSYADGRLNAHGSDRRYDAAASRRPLRIKRLIGVTNVLTALQGWFILVSADGRGFQSPSLRSALETWGERAAEE
jgi:hypothetical protein